MKINWPIILFSMSLSIIAVTVSNTFHEKIHRLQSDINYYHSTYLRKSGGTSLWSGSTNFVMYDLRSFDGGKNWYAVNNTDGVKILGKADEVYPGLMKQMDAVDAMVDYAKTNGPITLTKDSEIRLLQNAGFTVIKHTN
jgi:hypothetical protein